MRPKFRNKAVDFTFVMDWCWLFLLPPGLVWDIMGYEVEPLPSYAYIRNCSYSMMSNEKTICLLLRFIYHVLTSPSHPTARPRPPLRLNADFIKWIGVLIGHYRPSILL